MIEHATHIPKEIEILGVYLPPFLVIMIVAVVLAWLTARALNRFRLARHLANPPLVFVAMIVLYVLAIDAVAIRF